MVGGRRSRGGGWYLLLLTMLVTASACQAHLDVVVTVHEDGSGIVDTTTTLDADTAAGLLELDESGLLIGDLARAGWVLSAPVEEADGSLVVTAYKEFGTPSQFSEIMKELTTDAGPFRDFRLTRVKSFAQVDYELTGTIDTSGDLDSFGDTALVDDLGRPVSAIAARYGANEEHVHFRLEVVLPGEIQSESPTGLMDSEVGQLRSEWTASLADDRVIPVTLSSATTEVSALVLRGIAVVAALLALLAVLAQVLRVLIPESRRPTLRRSGSRGAGRSGRAGRSTRGAKGTRAGGGGRGTGAGGAGGGAAGKKDEQPGAESGEADGAAPDEDESGYRVVAMDAMGVLYREGNDIQALLVPFARERGSSASEEEIVARARTLSLGRMTTDQFWAAIGVTGDPTELDTAYLALHQLTPGVIKFLRTQRDQGIRNACISNDAAAWSARLRAQHDLEGLIDPWVISGAIGVRKPDPSIFEALRRMTGEAAAAIQIIDDDLDLLDAARELGFGTAWFAPEGTPEAAREHLLIRRFDVGDGELADAES